MRYVLCMTTSAVLLGGLPLHRNIQNGTKARYCVEHSPEKLPSSRDNDVPHFVAGAQRWAERAATSTPTEWPTQQRLIWPTKGDWRVPMSHSVGRPELESGFFKSWSKVSSIQLLFSFPSPGKRESCRWRTFPFIFIGRQDLGFYDRGGFSESVYMT